MQNLRALASKLDRVERTSPPVGTVGMWAGEGGLNPPTGWLNCDGAAVSRTTYADLYAVVGDTYGAGNGSTTFNLPNFTDRFPYGNITGDVGGTADATLVSHSHGGLTGNDNQHHTHSGTTGGQNANHGHAFNLLNHSHVNANGTVATFSDDIHAHAGGAGQASESP
ncbi:MAG: phage tail protein [Actinomycetota bacterium]|jgi:microcystin-dependent protein